MKGTHQLVFTMNGKYYDPYTSKMEENPFLSYLTNEASLKLELTRPGMDKEIYDLIIKKCVEDSKNLQFTYTAEDKFIQELGKNGFRVELDTELENNQGTVTELAKTVLKDTDWEVNEEESDVFVETLLDTMYEATLSKNISVRPAGKISKEEDRYYVPDETLENEEIIGNDVEQLNQGQSIFLFYSDLTEQNPNPMIIINAGNRLIKNDNEDYYTNVYNLLYTDNNPSIVYDTEGELPIPNFINPNTLRLHTAARGQKVIRQQKSGYDPNIDEYYLEYEKDIKTEESKQLSNIYVQYHKINKHQFFNCSSEEADFIFNHKDCIYTFIDQKGKIQFESTISKRSENEPRTYIINDSPLDSSAFTNDAGITRSYPNSFNLICNIQNKITKNYRGYEKTRYVSPELAQNYLVNAVNINGVDGWVGEGAPGETSSLEVTTCLSSPTEDGVSTISGENGMLLMKLSDQEMFIPDTEGEWFETSLAEDAADSDSENKTTELVFESASEESLGLTEIVLGQDVEVRIAGKQGSSYYRLDDSFKVEDCVGYQEGKSGIIKSGTHLYVFTNKYNLSDTSLSFTETPYVFVCPKDFSSDLSSIDNYKPYKIINTDKYNTNNFFYKYRTINKLVPLNYQYHYEKDYNKNFVEYEDKNGRFGIFKNNDWSSNSDKKLQIYGVGGLVTSKFINNVEIKELANFLTLEIINLEVSKTITVNSFPTDKEEDPKIYEKSTDYKAKKIAEKLITYYYGKDTQLVKWSGTNEDREITLVKEDDNFVNDKENITLNIENSTLTFNSIENSFYKILSRSCSTFRLKIDDTVYNCLVNTAGINNTTIPYTFNDKVIEDTSNISEITLICENELDIIKRNLLRLYLITRYPLPADDIIDPNDQTKNYIMEEIDTSSIINQDIKNFLDEINTQFVMERDRNGIPSLLTQITTDKTSKSFQEFCELTGIKNTIPTNQEILDIIQDILDLIDYNQKRKYEWLIGVDVFGLKKKELANRLQNAIASYEQLMEQLQKLDSGKYAEKEIINSRVSYLRTVFNSLLSFLGYKFANDNDNTVQVDTSQYTDGIHYEQINNIFSDNIYKGILLTDKIDLWQKANGFIDYLFYNWFKRDATTPETKYYLAYPKTGINYRISTPKFYEASELKFGQDVIIEDVRPVNTNHHLTPDLITSEKLKNYYTRDVWINGKAPNGVFHYTIGEYYEYIFNVLEKELKNSNWNGPKQLSYSDIFEGSMDSIEDRTRASRVKEAIKMFYCIKLLNEKDPTELVTSVIDYMNKTKVFWHLESNERQGFFKCVHILIGFLRLSEWHRTEALLEQEFFSMRRRALQKRRVINEGVGGNRASIENFTKDEEYNLAISLGKYKEGEKIKTDIIYGDYSTDYYEMVLDEEAGVNAYKIASETYELTQDGDEVDGLMVRAPRYVASETGDYFRCYEEEIVNPDAENEIKYYTEQYYKFDDYNINNFGNSYVETSEEIKGNTYYKIRKWNWVKYDYSYTNSADNEWVQYELINGGWSYLANNLNKAALKKYKQVNTLVEIDDGKIDTIGSISDEDGSSFLPISKFTNGLYGIKKYKRNYGQYKLEDPSNEPKFTLFKEGDYLTRLYIFKEDSNGSYVHIISEASDPITPKWYQFWVQEGNLYKNFREFDDERDGKNGGVYTTNNCFKQYNRELDYTQNFTKWKDGHIGPWKDRYTRYNPQLVHIYEGCELSPDFVYYVRHVCDDGSDYYTPYQQYDYEFYNLAKQGRLLNINYTNSEYSANIVTDQVKYFSENSAGDYVFCRFRNSVDEESGLWKYGYCLKNNIIKIFNDKTNKNDSGKPNNYVAVLHRNGDNRNFFLGYFVEDNEYLTPVQYLAYDQNDIANLNNSGLIINKQYYKVKNKITEVVSPKQEIVFKEDYVETIKLAKEKNQNKIQKYNQVVDGSSIVIADNALGKGQKIINKNQLDNYRDKYVQYGSLYPVQNLDLNSNANIHSRQFKVFTDIDSTEYIALTLLEKNALVANDYKYKVNEANITKMLKYRIGNGNEYYCSPESIKTIRDTTSWTKVIHIISEEGKSIWYYDYNKLDNKESYYHYFVKKEYIIAPNENNPQIREVSEKAVKGILNPIYRWSKYEDLTDNEKLAIKKFENNLPKSYYGYQYSGVVFPVKCTERNFTNFEIEKDSNRILYCMLPQDPMENVAEYSCWVKHEAAGATDEGYFLISTADDGDLYAKWKAKEVIDNGYKLIPFLKQDPFNWNTDVPPVIGYQPHRIDGTMLEIGRKCYDTLFSKISLLPKKGDTLIKNLVDEKSWDNNNNTQPTVSNEFIQSNNGKYYCYKKLSPHSENIYFTDDYAKEGVYYQDTEGNFGLDNNNVWESQPVIVFGHEIGKIKLRKKSNVKLKRYAKKPKGSEEQTFQPSSEDSSIYTPAQLVEKLTTIYSDDVKGETCQAALNLLSYLIHPYVHEINNYTEMYVPYDPIKHKAETRYYRRSSIETPTENRDLCYYDGTYKLWKQRGEQVLTLTEDTLRKNLKAAVCEFDYKASTFTLTPDLENSIIDFNFQDDSNISTFDILISEEEFDPKTGEVEIPAIYERFLCVRGVVKNNYPLQEDVYQKVGTVFYTDSEEEVVIPFLNGYLFKNYYYTSKNGQIINNFKQSYIDANQNLPTTGSKECNKIRNALRAYYGYDTWNKQKAILGHNKSLYGDENVVASFFMNNVDNKDISDLSSVLKKIDEKVDIEIPVLPTVAPDSTDLYITEYYIYDPEDNRSKTKATINYNYVGMFPLTDGGYRKKYDESCPKIRSIKQKEQNYLTLLQNINETFNCWAKYEYKHEDNGECKYKEKTIWVNENNENDVLFEEPKPYIYEHYLKVRRPQQVKEGQNQIYENVYIKMDHKWKDTPVGMRPKEGDILDLTEAEELNENNEISNQTDVSYICYYDKSNREFYFSREVNGKTRTLFNVSNLEEDCYKYDIINETFYQPKYKKKVIKVPEKTVTFKRYIGKVQNGGFKRGINLDQIQRNIDSDKLTSKLIVKNANNDVAKDGFCSIQRAGLNPIKENFALNFDYFIQKGLLDYETVFKDLYWPNTTGHDIGYYVRLSQINKDLDMIANRMADMSITLDKIEAKYDTYSLLQQAAMEEITKLTLLLNEKYDINLEGEWIFNRAKLKKLIRSVWTEPQDVTYQKKDKQGNLETMFEYINTGEYNTIEIDQYNDQVNKYLYEMDIFQANHKKYTDLMEKYKVYKDEYQAQIAFLIAKQKEMASQKERLNVLFYKKYYNYIKEGSWTSEKYLDDNVYYLDALGVLRTSAFPKISYSWKVYDLSNLEGYEYLDFEIGDKTFVEDGEFFGYLDNGRPYQEEVIIAQVVRYLDEPSKNTFTVQNYKTQFEDLFQRIAAATQSLSLNNGAYQVAAAAFNGNGTINADVLQKSLEDVGFDLVQNQALSIDKVSIVTNDIANNFKLRLANGALSYAENSDDYKPVINHDGLIANLLTGSLDIDRVQIISSSHPNMTWDAAGITAYSQEGAIIDYTSFTRFDQYGFYGIKNYKRSDSDEGANASYTPANLMDLQEKAHFGLTWDSFFIKSGNENERVLISSNQDIRMSKKFAGAWQDRLVIGKIVEDGEEYYGIEINDSTGNPTLRTDRNGGLTVSGTINARDGYIGKVTIEDGGLYHIDEETSALMFSLDKYGKLTARNAEISGVLKTTMLEKDSIQSVGGTVLVRPSYRIERIEKEIIGSNTNYYVVIKNNGLGTSCFGKYVQLTPNTEFNNDYTLYFSSYDHEKELDNGEVEYYYQVYTPWKTDDNNKLINFPDSDSFKDKNINEYEGGILFDWGYIPIEKNGTYRFRFFAPILDTVFTFEQEQEILKVLTNKDIKNENEDGHQVYFNCSTCLIYSTTSSFDDDEFICKVYYQNNGNDILLFTQPEQNPMGITISSDTGSETIPRNAFTIFEATNKDGNLLTIPKLILGDLNGRKKISGLFLSNNEENFDPSELMEGYGLWGDNVYLKGYIEADSGNINGIQLKTYYTDQYAETWEYYEEPYEENEVSYNTPIKCIASSYNESDKTGFIITSDGKIKANEMHLSGEIHVTEGGSVGPLSVTNGGIQYLDNNQPVFQVSSTGLLIARDAEITGTINATSGNIGNLFIDINGFKVMNNIIDKYYTFSNNYFIQEGKTPILWNNIPNGYQLFQLNNNNEEIKTYTIKSSIISSAHVSIGYECYDHQQNKLVSLFQSDMSTLLLREKSEKIKMSLTEEELKINRIETKNLIVESKKYESFSLSGSWNLTSNCYEIGGLVYGSVNCTSQQNNNSGFTINPGLKNIVIIQFSTDATALQNSPTVNSSGTTISWNSNTNLIAKDRTAQISFIGTLI